MPHALPVRRTRRSSLGILVAIVLAVVAAPTTGLAATPPLSGDGRLTATVTLPDDAGGGAFVGIDVLLTAISDGSVLGDVLSVTDDTGTVVFTDLPVSDGPTVVEWIVEAQGLETIVDPNGCETSSGWAAYDVVESGLDVNLSLTLQAVDETACPDDGPPPPDGVVNDATLAVTVTDDAGPVAGASVTIFAYLDDGELIFKAGEMTDEDGLATVGGMPRPEVDGPPVTWQVIADAWAEAPVDGCLWTRRGFGETALDASPGTTALAIELAWENGSAECDPPPDGSPVLRGTILDDTGAPFELELARLFQTRLDGATYATDITVDDSGAYQVPVHAWGTELDPTTLIVGVRSEITRTVVEGDCFWQYALMADTAITVALADGDAPPELDIVASEQEVSGGCGATGTPVPGDSSEGGSPVTAPGGPTVTLPPTDRAPATADAHDAGGLWPALTLLALVVAAAGWAARLTGRSSREA